RLPDHLIPERGDRLPEPQGREALVLADQDPHLPGRVLAGRRLRHGGSPPAPRRRSDSHPPPRARAPRSIARGTPPRPPPPPRTPAHPPAAPALAGAPPASVTPSVNSASAAPGSRVTTASPYCISGTTPSRPPVGSSSMHSPRPGR